MALQVTCTGAASFFSNICAEPHPHPHPNAAYAGRFKLLPKTHNQHQRRRRHLKLSCRAAETAAAAASDVEADAVPVIGGRRQRSIWINPNLKQDTSRRTRRSILLESVLHSLNSCQEPSQESISAILVSPDGAEAVKTARDVVFLLSRVNGWNRAFWVFEHFREQASAVVELDLVVYNLALKRLKETKRWDLCEQIMQQLLQQGIQPDNYTFTSLISNARQCDLHDKAIYWFQRMNELGCSPDTIIYSNMLDIFARAGNMPEALALYEKIMSEAVELDTMTFTRLIRLLYLAGDYKRALKTFYEIKGKGVKPDVHCYNRILDIVGRISRPWQLRELQTDMANDRISYNRITYATLIRAYCYFRLPDEAMECLSKMKQAGHMLDAAIYNHLLGMFADLAKAEDALKVYDEMKQSEKIKPDIWTYSALISLYSNTGNAPDAEKTLDEMKGKGITPNLYNYTPVIQGYGRLNMFDDVVRVFNRLLEEGNFPDFRLCGSLLSFLRHTTEEDYDKVLGCIKKCNPSLASVVEKLTDETSDMELLKSDLKALLGDTHEDGKKPYCNLLIDICRKHNINGRAHDLMDFAASLDIYKELKYRSSTEWVLNLKTLSSGAAFTALEDWIQDISKAIESGEELPDSVAISTGLGRSKVSDRSLSTYVENHLKEIHAPFQKDPYKAGWFQSPRDALVTWLKSENQQTQNPEILL